MVLLSRLKKQINQFVTPEIEVIPEEKINFYPQKNENKQPLENLQEDKKTVVTNHPTAYSHGLEAIYAIETIDVKTIKPLNFTQESETLFSYKKYTHPKYDPEFSFGETYNRSINSFILNEPVTVLDLSKQAIQTLTEVNLYYIRDLIKIDFEQIDLNSKLKRIASELQPKLEIYLQGKELFNCVTIDFEAWIKSLISDRHVKFYFLLKEYELTHLMSLTPIMQVEIKKIKENEKLKYVNESKIELNHIDIQELNKLNQSIIVNAFLIPWVNSKEGIFQKYELLDYLEQISENPYNFYSCMRFLSDIFNDGKCLFEKNFIPIYKNIYCSSPSIYKMYKNIETRLFSYFSKGNEIYEINELMNYVSKELSFEWISIKIEFIKKVLKTSPHFLLKNDENFEIKIYLNPSLFHTKNEK